MTTFDLTTTTLPAGVTWRALGTTVHLLVTDPRRLAVARRAVAQVLADVDATYSRFRADSELRVLAIDAGRDRLVSPLLARALGTALRAAQSGGDPAAGPASSSGMAGGTGGQARTDGALAAIPGGMADGVPPASGTAPTGGPTGGGMGGTSADETLVAYLAEHAGSARWIVAVSGSGTAATIQLASGLPVMAMGGFNGCDAAPTLEQLQVYIASGELRFVLLGSGGGGGGGSSSSSTSDRDAWVTSTCAVADTGSSSGTLYDCAGATGG